MDFTRLSVICLTPCGPHTPPDAAACSTAAPILGLDACINGATHLAQMTLPDDTNDLAREANAAAYFSFAFLIRSVIFWAIGCASVPVDPAPCE